MNEVVGPGDYVLLISDNYNSDSFEDMLGKIGKVVELYETILGVDVNVGTYIRQEDLGYFTYKKLTQPMFKLLL